MLSLISFCVSVSHREMRLPNILRMVFLVLAGWFLKLCSTRLAKHHLTFRRKLLNIVKHCREFLRIEKFQPSLRLDVWLHLPFTRTWLNTDSSMFQSVESMRYSKKTIISLNVSFQKHRGYSWYIALTGAFVYLIAIVLSAVLVFMQARDGPTMSRQNINSSLVSLSPHRDAWRRHLTQFAAKWLFWVPVPPEPIYGILWRPFCNANSTPTSEKRKENYCILIRAWFLNQSK